MEFVMGRAHSSGSQGRQIFSVRASRGDSGYRLSAGLAYIRDTAGESDDFRLTGLYQLQQGLREHGEQMTVSMS
jgi:hypothetical protein